MKMTNVWNYTVILFELATGKLPFEGLHPAQVGMESELQQSVSFID